MNTRSPQPKGFTLADLPQIKDLAFRVRDHLMRLPAFFDFGTAEVATHERALIQLILVVNRQTYFSLLGALETDHVVLAAQGARALLEESIRWEWMTDAPEARMSTLVGELRRNLHNIEMECRHLGANGDAFLNPSPFWNTETLRPFEGGRGFPSVEQMLIDIEKLGESQGIGGRFPVVFKIRRASTRNTESFHS